MINNDRIVPITRTDLLSFFAAIFKVSTGNAMNILPVEDGTVTLPAGASGAYLAAEPLKVLPTIGNGVTIYFVPAYDFDMTLTPEDDAPAFVANPGNLHSAQAGPGGTIITQLDTGAAYTVA